MGTIGNSTARSFVDVSVERDDTDLVIAFRDERGRHATVSLGRAHASMLTAAMVLATASDDFSDTYASRMRGELETREAR